MKPTYERLRVEDVIHDMREHAKEIWHTHAPNRVSRWELVMKRGEPIPISGMLVRSVQAAAVLVKRDGGEQRIDVVDRSTKRGVRSVTCKIDIYSLAPAPKKGDQDERR